MSDYNPYQASSVPGLTAASSPQSGGISPTVISHLSRTKPWVQFIGVLGMIAAGLILLAALFAMLGGGMASSAIFGGAKGAPPAAFMIAGGAVYLLIGAVYLFISMKLFGYGSAIGTLRYSGQVEHLELALDRQRSVWKSIGVLTLLMIVVWIIAVIGAAIFATKMVDGASRKFPPPISAPGEAE